MSRLAEVVAALQDAGIDHALIGAMALAALGMPRSTLDIDLRFGDEMDPLAGVVRIDPEGSEPIDLVVGRPPRWQKAILERARTRVIALAGAKVPIVEPADLVLLELYAGGPRDHRDIEDLLELPSMSSFAAEVDGRVADLPTRCREAWSRLRPATR